LPAKILTLSRDRFTRQDLAIAQSILAGKKYAAIAHEQKIALITVKRRAKKLFIYANMKNALNFVDKYKNYTVELGIE
jgi:DNA-binding NarL/FixJ family response regulator